MFLGRKKPLRDPRRGQAPCTPAFLDQDRSSVLLGRGASAHSRPRVPTIDRSALLVRLWRLGDSGGTQGNAEADVEVAASRRERVPGRRPTTGHVAPTAAPAHATQARRRTNWILHRRSRIDSIPVRTPLPDITMHVIQTEFV